MFFYAAKLLWIVAQPSNLIALAIGAGALLTLSRRQQLGRRLLLVGLVAFFVAGMLPLGSNLTMLLENRFARTDLATGPPVTGIIVLGGAEDLRAGVPRELAGLNESAERYTEAAALARRLPQARVIFSGGSGSLISRGMTEATVADRLLQALGVDKARLELEDQARDTFENAIYTKRLVAPKADERWLLITSAWHMPRAMGCFRKAGFAVEPWPVDYRTNGRLVYWPGASPFDGLRRVDNMAREYLGLIAYALTGRTNSLFPGPE